jgi:hypothetical protein
MASNRRVRDIFRGQVDFYHQYLGTRLQLTGSQVVDYWFTVMRYSSDDKMRHCRGLRWMATHESPLSNQPGGVIR